MTTRTGSDVRARREQVVLEHMRSENEQCFDVTIGTFGHPRYELIPTGEIIDGFDAVAAYYVTGRKVFPDQRNELIALHHTDAGVIIEFWLRGTHLGGDNPTGRAFKCQMVAIFIFDGDRITCERVYYDQATIRRQLQGEETPAE
jgi:ketosteroid isomerase-like protein